MATLKDRRLLAAFAFMVGTLGCLRPARAECGDGVLDSEEEECDVGAGDEIASCDDECRLSCDRVGDAATEHTCLHGSSGPFAARAAVASPGPPNANVSPSHTYFTVTLAGPPDENRSVVSFSPNSSRPYALYMKEEYPVRLLDGEGNEVATRLEHDVTECALADALMWVRVFETLDDSETYVLELGPWGATTMSFAFESLGFEKELYLDADGDGFGRAGDPAARSWCVPPGGFAERSRDCDDARADSYPGAPEVCDGRNNDCDGRTDDTESGLCEGNPAGGVCLIEAGRCGCAAADDCASGSACERGQCTEPGPASGGEGGSGATPDESGSAGTDGRPSVPRSGTSSGGCHFAEAPNVPLGSPLLVSLFGLARLTRRRVRRNDATR